MYVTLYSLQHAFIDFSHYLQTVWVYVYIKH